MKIKQDELDNLFAYHPPTDSQRKRYEELRAGAKAFAELVVRLTPGCADQRAAVRHIREAVMTANAAIACEPDPDYIESEAG